MSVTTPRKGRPPERRERVVEYLRRCVVAGTLAPGDRLPAYEALQARFCADPPTIRDAIAVLREDGFIETHLRRGTFVVPHPPHLARYAVIFPVPQSQMGDSQFFRAIRDEAEGMEAPDCRISNFFDIAGHVDTEDYARLSTFVAAHRLAGEIFAYNPLPLLNGDCRLLKSGIPRVAVMIPTAGVPFPVVYPDLAAFKVRALRYLVSQGRRRIAHLVVAHGQSSDDLIDPGIQAARKAVGLDPVSPWIQGVPLRSPAWARQVVRLLFHADAGKRPDALIIHDDNLVPEAARGLVEAGVRVRACGEPSRSGDVEVVAHANFPWPTSSAVPAKRLGFDITELIRVCRERIDQQRRGERPSSRTLIPAVFEEELKKETS